MMHILVVMGFSVSAPAADTPETDDAAAVVSDAEMQQLMQSLQADADNPDNRALGAESESGPASVPAPRAPSVGTGMTSFQSMNPDISLILDAAAAYFSADEPLQAGAHDPSERGFNLQQLEMHIASNVDPFFRLEANLVFSLFGVEVEEAYGQTLALPGRLQARVGQFLTRFGRINPTHPHSWQFADQPLVNGKLFGGEGSRALGAELSWLLPLPWYAEAVATAGQPAGDCCSRSFANDGVRSANDLIYTSALKQFVDLSDDWSLLFGLSGQLGRNPTGNQNRTDIYGTDLYLRYRPRDSTNRSAVSLQVEAMLRRRQVPDDLLQDYGLYAQVVWSISAPWECGARYEYVSGIDGDPIDPHWISSRQKVSAQGTYYPSHFSRLRLQVNYDMPAWRRDPILALFAAVELLVGAHGSHNY